MWFATDGGLNRFDGISVKQYYSQHLSRSIPSNSVPCLISTSDGKLFVGTSAGLAEYIPETDDFTPLFCNGIALKDIFAMQQGNGTELLISTENQGAYIYNYSKNEFRKVKLGNERIFGMTVDKEGLYWGFSRFTVYRFDQHNKILETFKVSGQLFKSAISYAKSDKKGVLWIGTFENGLFTFNFRQKQFEPFVSSNKVEMYYIRTIEEGKNPNEYWVGTEKGLYVINITTGFFEHYVQTFDPNRKSINDNAIYKVFRNDRNVFFIGTYFGGVNIAKSGHFGFNAYFPDDKPGYLQGKAIGTIAKAPDGKLWIATEDAGIAIFNQQTKTFTHLFSNTKDKSTLSTNNIHALLMDGKYCWVGHFMGGISKMDISTKKAKRFQNDPNQPNSLSNNFVFALYRFSPDSILVGTISGIDILNRKTETFSRFRENELHDCFVYDIFSTPDGKIWILTYNKGIFILDKNNKGLMAHFQAGDRSGLPCNSVISHCVDSKKQIWIGTRGGGLSLFHPSVQKFTNINSDKMLPDNVVYGIEDDPNGYLWISSNKGISRLHFSDSTSVHFNYRYGIAGNQYNYKSYFKDTDGTIYFGSVSGLTAFNPLNIVTPSEVPKVYFTNLLVSNKIILPGTSGVLSRQIDYSDKVKLKHYQNSFTFEFSSINYFEGDVAYQYCLEGLDKNWSPATDRMQANYTNLSPGTYIFHVRAMNKISKQTGDERSIVIIISPPFWASWWAYILYLISFVLIVRFSYRAYTNRHREKVALTIEKLEKENLRLLHQHKMNFFTNISHEFKTPLTIIIASIEMLLKQDELKDTEKEEVKHTIKRSAMRLLTLVNQLMEFRKIESDHAIIKTQKGDIVDFFNQNISVYRPLLEKKNIELRIQAHYELTEIYFDFDKLEKIFTNLLTNAVKYTPSDGIITLNLNITNSDFSFSVQDSGKGLNPEQKERIFDIFYSETEANPLLESSGVGLALTASLVKLLKGEIRVDSEPGEGSKFTVRLPYADKEEHPETYERQLSATDLPDIIPADTFSDDAAATDSNKEYSILIAEDNKDLLKILVKRLGTKFKVKGVENGLDAWNFATEKIPDIVITDVMMPLMGGFELCEKIKTDVNLCHIPVVMLTAKTANEDKMQGLRVGADFYIPKPFAMEELETVLHNLVKTRKMLLNKLTDLARIEGFVVPASNQEHAFVEKVFELIEQHIGDSSLDVQFLAGKLNISRTSLHNKLTSTMNMSATKFINSVRINKSKELMRTTDLTFSEIAYKVGFGDSAYFSRIFKKLTGKTPGEFRKSINS